MAGENFNREDCLAGPVFFDYFTELLCMLTDVSIGNTMADPENQIEREIVVGRITAAFGVRGWLKVASFTDPPTNILDYKPWLLCKDSQRVVVNILQGQQHGKNIIVQIAGCDDRDQALKWVGNEIKVARDCLPDAGNGHYYWTDLQGLTVVTSAGVELGKVTYLFATGSNDVMVVNGDKECLIPFLVGSVIMDVQLDEGIIRVNWDPDL